MLRKLDVNAFADTLKYKGWGDGTSGRNYSALQVLANPKKYPDEMRRIKHANLSYPIIFFELNKTRGDGFIVDGVHRLVKATLEKRKHINAYIFDRKMMNKFKIAKDGEWEKVDNMADHELIELFFKRFC